jgi:general stress protein 26
MTTEQKDKILELLQTNHVGVIATHGDGLSPESAVITISQTEDLDIVFGSSELARKNHNIARNPHVSLVVGWDIVARETLQIEGVVVRVSDSEREKIEVLHCAKNPLFAKYNGNPSFQYFKLQPHWIRYANLSAHHPGVWEVTL